MNSPANLFATVAKRSSRAAAAPFLPMSRAEMDTLGWDSCDIILVTGDAYIDHPSFGMALVGRLLEAQGYRVGIISQPDWTSVEPFRALGKPNLYWGITAGNMDSMVNRYTADRKIRSDDAYTANAEPNKRPDRAVTVYCQRAREAFPGVPVIAGSIEASLRRIAHYDYWSDKVRRSVLFESKADLLIFGNAERALVDVTRRIAAGENIKNIRDLRGTAFLVPQGWLPDEEWSVHNSTRVDVPGRIDKQPNPYAMALEDPKACALDNAAPEPEVKPVVIMTREQRQAAAREKAAKTVVRLPSFETVSEDPVMYAHASRVFLVRANPAAAAAGDGRDGQRLRPAVRARAAPELWQGPYPGLGNDPLLGQHHARLLRRLHLLLDHRARRPHHPEPLGAVDPARDRTDPRHDQELRRHHHRPGRPDGEYVPPGLQGQEDRGNLPPPVVRVSVDLHQPGHRPQQADLAVPQGARHPRHQEDPDRFRAALRPGGALARVRQGTGDPPRGRPAQDRAGAYRAGHLVQDDEAGHRRL